MPAYIVKESDYKNRRLVFFLVTMWLRTYLQCISFSKHSHFPASPFSNTFTNIVSREIKLSSEHYINGRCVLDKVTQVHT